MKDVYLGKLKVLIDKFPGSRIEYRSLDEKLRLRIEKINNEFTITGSDDKFSGTLICTEGYEVTYIHIQDYVTRDTLSMRGKYVQETETRKVFRFLEELVMKFEDITIASPAILNCKWQARHLKFEIDSLLVERIGSKAAAKKLRTEVGRFNTLLDDLEKSNGLDIVQPYWVI